MNSIDDDIEILKKCAGAYPDIVSTIELTEAIEHFKEIYLNYDQLMTKGEGYKIDRSTEQGKLDKEFMEKLYGEQFVDKKGCCRDEYDRIRATASKKLCPMCAVGTISVLDHHFPKSSYFLYSIYSKNLVPICSHCNTAKKDTMPNHTTKQFIHPYYDDFSKEQWFEVRFISQEPISLIYECKENDHLSKEKREKLKSHFKHLKLAESYIPRAILRLGDLKNVLCPLLETKDWVSVNEELTRSLNLVSGRRDSWEYALYKKLINEKWYIEGGFMNIDEEKP